MNIKQYREKKLEGLAEIVRAGGGYAFATRKFSSDDGTELTPEIVSIDTEEINRRKTDLLSEIDDCDAVLSDVGKLV